jgi:hypothetical protein
MGSGWVVVVVGTASPPSGTAKLIRNSHRSASNYEKNTNFENIYCFGGADESNGGNGNTAATVALAVKKFDGEEEEEFDAAAASPHAAAPVRAPSSHNHSTFRVRESSDA